MSTNMSSIDNLCHAIYNGTDLDTIKSMIDTSGVDVNSLDSHGISLLEHAIHRTRQDVFHYLLQEAGSVPTINDLCVAVNMNKSLDDIKSMIETSGVDVNSVDSRGRSPLFHAIHNSTSQDVFHYLLQEAGSVPTINDLCCAVSMNKTLDDIKSMIETSGVDVNSVDSDGSSLLWHAIYRKRQDAFHYLLQEAGSVPSINDVCCAVSMNKPLDVIKSMIETSGVNVNSVDSDDRTPLFHAIHRKRQDVFHYLLQEAGSVPTINDLCDAIWEDIDIDDIKSMIETSGVDVNSVDSDGESLLWYAIHRTREDVFHYLLQEAGSVPSINDLCLAVNMNKSLDDIKSMIEISEVDVNSVDTRGKSLLWHAIHNSTGQDVFHYLLHEAGSVPTINDLCCAIEMNKTLDDIKSMIEISGVDVNSWPTLHDYENCSLLCFALCKKHQDVALYLMHEAGVVPKVTEITAAIVSGMELQMIKSMVETSGVDVNSLSSETDIILPATPLFHAADGNRIDVAQYLLHEAGACVAVRLKEGFDTTQTPLMAAAECGHSEMCELLLRHGGLCTIDDVDTALPEEQVVFLFFLFFLLFFFFAFFSGVVCECNVVAYLQVMLYST